MGLNRPAIDIKKAYTFLSTQMGTEDSGAVGMTFSMHNTATDYQSGDEFHVEGALNQHFPIGLPAGVGGYCYQQITVTSVPAPRLDTSRAAWQRFGLLLSYTFQADKQEVTLSGR